MRPQTMEMGMLERAWGARKVRLGSTNSPRYSVYRCPDFIGVSVVDRATETWGGLWDSREAAWEWIDGTAVEPMLPSFQLRQVPWPLRRPLDIWISRYLADSPVATCKEASVELGCRMDHVYRVAKEDGISFRERREKQDKAIVRFVGTCPEAGTKEVAEFLGVTAYRVSEARKQAGTTHRDMVRKRREGILRDLQDGLLWREIAKKHGVDEQEIWVVAKTNNIHSAGRSRGNPRRPPITQETEDAAVRLLRDTPKGYREITEELSLPWRSILTRIARKHGLRGYAPRAAVMEEGL